MVYRRIFRILMLVLVLLAGTPSMAFACCCDKPETPVESTAAHDCCDDMQAEPAPVETSDCEDCTCLFLSATQYVASSYFVSAEPTLITGSPETIASDSLMLLSLAGKVPTPPPRLAF